MPKLTPLAVILAALFAFIASSLWYGVLFGSVWQSLATAHGAAVGFEPWQAAAQFVRNLVVASALLWLLQRTGALALPAAMPVAGVLWFGFEAMAILGSVIHEGYPPVLYLIHAGDALLATTVMTVTFSLWPKHG